MLTARQQAERINRVEQNMESVVDRFSQEYREKVGKRCREINPAGGRGVVSGFAVKKMGARVVAPGISKLITRDNSAYIAYVFFIPLPGF